MRNRLAALLIVSITVLAACGGSDGESTDTVPVTEPAVEEPVTTEPPATSTTTTTTTVPQVFEGATVVVANGNIVGGSAGRMSDALATAGFTMGDPVTATVKQDESAVYYTAVAGAQPVAETLGIVMGGIAVEPLPTPIPTESGTLDDAQVLLLLGNDEADQPLDELAAAAQEAASGNGDAGSTDDADDAASGEGDEPVAAGSENTVVVANASGVAASAGAMSDELESAGFTVGTPTNSDERLEATIVYYAPDAQAEAEAVAEALGGVESLPMPAEVPTVDGELDGTILVLLGSDEAGSSIADLAE